MGLSLACGPSAPGETSDSEATTLGPSTGPDGSSTAAPDASSTSTSAGGTTSEPTTGDATTSEPTTGEPTTGAPLCLSFETFEHPRDEFNTPPMFTCDLPELCPGDEPLVFDLDSDPDDSSALAKVAEQDFGRALCMVTALRDRSPGHIRYQAWFSGLLGTYFLRDEVLPGDAGTRMVTWTQDFNFTWTEDVKRLREPAFFADCLEVGTATALWHCLREAYADECMTALECRP